MQAASVLALTLVVVASTGCVERLTAPELSVCDLATDAEVRDLLDAERVEVPANQLGEETAPYCLWATNGRITEMKLEVWSPLELEAVLQTDAKSYFEKRWHDAGSVRKDWPGVGEAAFYAAFDADDPANSVVEIVVRKGGRVLIFNGVRVELTTALAFATAVSGRI